MIVDDGFSYLGKKKSKTSCSNYPLRGASSWAERKAETNSVSRCTQSLLVGVLILILVADCFLELL